MAKVTGQGVTIYIDTAASGGVNITDSGALTLTSPTSGTYEGISLYQSPSVSAFNVSGAATLKFSGTIDAPGATIQITGSGGVAALGSELISRDLTISGSASLSISADAENRTEGSNALKVAGGPAPQPTSQAPLTQAALKPVVQQAIAGWVAAGLDSRVAAQLEDVVVQIAPLPAPYLGLAGPGIIWLDPTAEGYGWFISAASDPGAAVPRGRIDLLTVVSHELGHEFGLEDGDGTPLMAPTLSPGIRVVPGAGDLAAPHASNAIGTTGAGPTSLTAGSPGPVNHAVSISPSLRDGSAYRFADGPEANTIPSSQRHGLLASLF